MRVSSVTRDAGQREGFESSSSLYASLYVRYCVCVWCVRICNARISYCVDEDRHKKRKLPMMAHDAGAVMVTRWRNGVVSRKSGWGSAICFFFFLLFFPVRRGPLRLYLYAHTSTNIIIVAPCSFLAMCLDG